MTHPLKLTRDEQGRTVSGTYRGYLLRVERNFREEYIVAYKDGKEVGSGHSFASLIGYIDRWLEQP